VVRSGVRRAAVVALFAGAFLLFGVGFSAAYGASDPVAEAGAASRSAEASRVFRIITLKHISTKQGREYLSQIGIGPASALSGSPSLLVTGKPEDVARAKVMLDVVDSPQEFAVKVMGSSLKAEILPSSEAISEKAGGVAVGTFSSPPKESGGAIVDVHNGSLVIIAQASRIERIVAAVGKLLQDKLKDGVSQRETQVEPGKEAAKPVKTTPEAAIPKIDRTEDIHPVDANAPRTRLDEVSRSREGPIKSQPPRPEEVEEPKKSVGGLYEPVVGPGVSGDLKVTLPAKLDIIQLLQLAGEYLNLNFMYDPVKIKGEVTILWTGNQKGTIKVNELYPLMESVLQFHGFAMTRNAGANMVTVTPEAEVMEKDPPLVETDDDRITEYGNVIVTRIFKLEYIDSASAQNLLTGMKLGTNVSPVGDSKVLFVTGYAYRMPRVERLLKMIDKPGIPKKIRFRQLKFTMATALAPKVKTLAEQLGAVQITVGQMSSPSGPTTSSARLPGETTADYTRRLAGERAARTTPPARISTPGAPTTTQPGVYLDADERTNRILMIGFDDELDSVEELIDTLDVEQTDLRTMKLYPIEHIDADQARKKLQELGIISSAGLSSSSSSSRLTGGSTRVGAATRTVSPAGATTAPPAPTPTATMSESEGGLLQGLAGEPTVVIIEPTNSLLVNATPEQHAQIGAILKYVDARTETGTIPYVIYPLENQKPEDLATILEKLIQETVKDKEGKVEQVIKKTDEEIVIVPDENTFSIIVYASKKNQEWIKNLIETLDKRRPQVLIDVTLVEVRRNDEFNYDLNLIEAFPDLTTGTSVIGGAVLPPGATGSGRDHYVEFATTVGEEGTGGTGFYADKHVNFLLTAMQKKGYGRVLAKPKILVNDNEKGSIGTTMTKYIEKTSSVPVVPAGGVEQQGIPTFQTAIDYTPYDAGIQLDITPHISEGQLLRLEIALTRSDFEIREGQAGPPDTTSNDITTVVTVPDGSTVILGGMIKLDQSKGGKKVPFLGDIPLVGLLFRGVGNKEDERKLYVFVKAEIIRPAETLAQGLSDLEKISQRNRLSFEKFENEFQSYKSFPGMKSKPMEPAKVLDTE